MKFYTAASKRSGFFNDSPDYFGQSQGFTQNIFSS
jgi:hypothetical protein